ncbi:MAG: hypothetical protein GX454_13940 [Brooklawnia sp.]|nr:hypothetical protein [Brooklawnia sp.]
MSRTRQFAKRCATAGLAVVVAFALGACGSGSTGAADAARSGSQSQATADSGLTGGVQISGDQYPLSITDFVGHAITLDHKPERVCVISGTPLNIWYDRLIPAGHPAHLWQASSRHAGQAYLS